MMPDQMQCGYAAPEQQAYDRQAAEVEETLKKGFPALRFPAWLESAFDDYYYSNTLKRVRVAILTGVILYGIFGIVDLLLAPVVKEKFWLIRYAVVCPVGFLVLICSGFSGFKRLLQPAIWLAMQVGGLGLIAMIAISPVLGHSYYYTGLILVIMYTFTLVGMRFWYGVSWAVITLSCYAFVTSMSSNVPLPVLVHNSFSVFSAACIGAISNYLMEHYSRRDFLQNILLEAEKQQLQETGRKLERLSSLDELTGIANRRHFERFFEQEWLRALRSRTSLAMILIDIDSFKAYNDNYGHQAGDSCLKLVAKRLARSARRPGDLVARYGGEEFVMVLAGTELADAGKIAEAFRADVEALGVSHTHADAGVVTISAGVAALLPAPGLSRRGLLEAADKALYQAKRSGRNRIILSEAATPLHDQAQAAGFAVVHGNKVAVAKFIPRP